MKSYVKTLFAYIEVSKISSIDINNNIDHNLDILIQMSSWDTLIDLADNLGMALNTVEYNLNKLLKSGLVIKSKNFVALIS